MNRLIPSRQLTAPALSGLLAVLLFGFAFASASDALHDSLHADSSVHAGVCLVCLLLQGQLECAATLVVAVAVLTFVGSLPAPREVDRAVLAALLPPGRAPPAFGLAF